MSETHIPSYLQGEANGLARGIASQRRYLETLHERLRATLSEIENHISDLKHAEFVATLYNEGGDDILDCPRCSIMSDEDVPLEFVPSNVKDYKNLQCPECNETYNVFVA